MTKNAFQALELMDAVRVALKHADEGHSLEVAIALGRREITHKTGEPPIWRFRGEQRRKAVSEAYDRIWITALQGF